MDRLERGMLVLVALSAVGLFYVALYRKPHSQPAAPTPEPVLLTASPEQVLGTHKDFRGSADSPFTLVEFADYECPPCAGANATISGLLNQYKSRLRLAFRNYPLTSIHPDALPSALAAEAVRDQGKFWPMHDALFACHGRLDTAARDALLARLQIDRPTYDRALTTTAKAAVEFDIADGKRFKVPGTPTFFLVCPDARVFRLGALGQLKSFLKQPQTAVSSVPANP